MAHGKKIGRSWSQERCINLLFIHSFAMFCYVFLCDLRGSAWAACSYSIGTSTNFPKNIQQNITNEWMNNCVNVQNMNHTP